MPLVAVMVAMVVMVARVMMARVMMARVMVCQVEEVASRAREQQAQTQES